MPEINLILMNNAMQAHPHEPVGVHAAAQPAEAAAIAPDVVARRMPLREDMDRLRALRRWRNNEQLERFVFGGRELPERGWQHIDENNGIPHAIIPSPWQMYNDLTRDPAAVPERNESRPKRAWREVERHLALRSDPHPSGLTDEQKALYLAGRSQIDWSRRRAGSYTPPLHLLSTMHNVESLSLAGRNMRLTPSIPSATVKNLRLDQNKIGRLGRLPDQVEYLNASDNHIRKITRLPQNLEALDIQGNRLSRLSQLPAGLKILDASNNHRLKIVELPNSLERLTLANNESAHVPEFPASLQELVLSGNRLTAGIALPPNLRFLNLNRNANLMRLPRLPASLERLDATGCRLQELPERLPRSLRALVLDGNRQLTRMPDLAHCGDLQIIRLNNCRLQSIGRLPASTRSVDLAYNAFRTVPNTLLEAANDCEIFLAGNAIPQAEQHRVAAECTRRRAAGLTAPIIYFREPGTMPRQMQILGDAARDLGGLENVNAHQSRIANVFRSQIEALGKMYPNILGADAQPFSVIEKTDFAERIRRDVHAVPAVASVKQHAAKAIKFIVSESETQYARGDFSTTPLDVLRVVDRFINDLPAERQAEGRALLQFHLAAAGGLQDRGYQGCSTRCVEEMLSSIAPFDNAPKMVTWETARDTLVAEAKNVFAETDRHAGGDDATLKEQFFAALETQVHRENPNISNAQYNRFLGEYITEHWETFKNQARE